MKAALAEFYGPPDVIRVADVERPTPRGDEVLVRVVATAVTAGDARIRGGRFPRGFTPFARLAFGVRRPRRPILGGTFSGVVEAVGRDVTGLAPGDEVCGMTGARMGTHAEHAAVPASRVVRKPAAVTHDDAAAMLFGGTTALHFLRDKASVSPGDSVLVNGASGAIGTNAVQLARHFGATVTAVTSTANARLVEDLGADKVVDYAQTPLSDLTERFDVVLDTVGNLSPTSGRRLLTDRGVLLLAVADLWDMLRARGAVKAGSAPERAEDFELLLQLMTDGRLVAVHDPATPPRGLGLEGLVTAYERVDSGRKVGNVVIRP